MRQIQVFDASLEASNKLLSLLSQVLIVNLPESQYELVLQINQHYIVVANCRSLRNQSTRFHRLLNAPNSDSEFTLFGKGIVHFHYLTYFGLLRNGVLCTECL